MYSQFCEPVQLLQSSSSLAATNQDRLDQIGLGPVPKVLVEPIDPCLEGVDIVEVNLIEGVIRVPPVPGGMILARGQTSGSLRYRHRGPVPVEIVPALPFQRFGEFRLCQVPRLAGPGPCA